MGPRFEGRTAIVTGGGSGIGKAIAKRLMEEGAAVLITGRTPETLEVALAEIEPARGRAWTLVSDVSKPEQVECLVESAIQRWGHIDVLINNAGLFDEADFLDITKEGWDLVLAVLLTGPFLLSQRVAREMVGRGGGSIVNIASIDGHGADGPYTSYSVAKAGLMMLTKNAAVQLAQYGVRCNSISPGWALTPMVESAATPSELEQMKRAFRRVPLMRLITPEEVAAACAFLASDEASGITGTDLVVDGGTLANLFVLETLSDRAEISTSA